MGGGSSGTASCLGGPAWGKRAWAAQEHEEREPFKSLRAPEERKAFIAELHRLKTNIFMRMVESGAMPLRPGVRRLVGVHTLTLTTP